MDISQFEKFAEEAAKSSPGVNKLVSDVSLAWFLEEAQYPETTFEDVNERLRNLFSTAMKSGDWKNVEMLAKGKAEYVNASFVVMKHEEANATPMSDLSHEKTVEKVPLWISAYANIYLAHGKIIRKYVSSPRNALMSDAGFESLVERRAKALETGMKGIGKKKTNDIEILASIKLVHDATKFLEKELRQNMPQVTKTPGFYLLLSSYETLHAEGFRPSFFDADVPENASYLDLVQAILEMFPEDSRPDVREYLENFQSSGDEGDFRSSLMSRIDYEGDMERMSERGVRRQAAVDGLMSRIRASVREGSEASEE